MRFRKVIVNVVRSWHYRKRYCALDLQQGISFKYHIKNHLELKVVFSAEKQRIEMRENAK